MCVSICRCAPIFIIYIYTCIMYGMYIYIYISICAREVDEAERLMSRRIFKLKTRVALLHLHFFAVSCLTVEAGHPLPLGCRWVSCKVASVCVCECVRVSLCVCAATSLASSLPAHELKNMENRSMPCTATP